jgi:hypothetical protein
MDFGGLCRSGSAANYMYIYIYIYLYRRQRRSCIAADKLQHIDIELRPSISVVVEN